MTIWNDNAAAFATTAEVAVDQERRHGITVALTAIGSTPVHPAARPVVLDFAFHTMLRSVHRQARCAGVVFDYRLLTHPENHAGGVNVTTIPSLTPGCVAEGRPTSAAPTAGTCAPGDPLAGVR